MNSPILPPPLAAANTPPRGGKHPPSRRQILFIDWPGEPHEPLWCDFFAILCLFFGQKGTSRRCIYRVLSFHETLDSSRRLRRPRRRRGMNQRRMVFATAKRHNLRKHVFPHVPSSVHTYWSYLCPNLRRLLHSRWSQAYQRKASLVYRSERVA